MGNHVKERKQKTLTYKHVIFNAPNINLASALKLALNQLNIGKRRESIGPSGESPIWRVIGHYKTEDEFIFGVLMRYVPGTHRAFLIDDETADSFTIEQFAAPITEEGQRRELVEEMLFFGAVDNHLVLMQSTGLKSQHLEIHIQWLLHKAHTLSNSHILQLTDEMPKAIAQKLSKQSVKAFEFGGAFLPEVQPNDQVTGNFNLPITPSTLEGASSNGVLTAIKSLLSVDKSSVIDFSDLDDTNIEYTLTLKYRRKTSTKGQELMNILGSALRHAEGVNTKIHLVGGGEINGDDLKLSGSVGINMYDGIPAADEVFNEMKKWLLDKLKAGDIKPS